MSTGTKIEWTDTTWNPVVGCTPVSPGCLNCYAATFASRGMHERYVGLTVRRKGEGGRTRAVFNGTVRTVPEVLEAPLHWRKPRRVFVNSMSDLFHEAVPFEFIDKVFAVMALCPHHTFQVLTKRPERMAEYLTRREISKGWTPSVRGGDGGSDACKWKSPCDAVYTIAREQSGERLPLIWPLPNVWLGTSCEDQAAAYARIPHLLRCPAAVRFLSCEPLLGAVDILEAVGKAADDDLWHEAHEWAGDCELCGGEGVREYTDAPDEWGEDCPSEVNHLIVCRGCAERRLDMLCWMAGKIGLHWVIAGGESGKGARPCDVGWIRSIVGQCRSADVPVFVKQLGANPGEVFMPSDPAGADGAIGRLLMLRDKKGGNPDEWPEDLRVREFPEAVRA